MTKTELRKLWKTRVTEFRASGQSVPKWCAAHNLKPHQLRYWLKKYEEKDPVKKTTSWLPLNLSESEPKLTIRVGQAFIEVKPGFDANLLVEVVGTLTQNAK